jgi:hypothetical protein
MPRRENDLRGSKSAHFLRPPEFVSGPPREGSLTQIPGGHLAKILTANHFLFLDIISEQPLSLMARFFTRFLPNIYYYSFSHLLFKDFLVSFEVLSFFFFMSH